MLEKIISSSKPIYKSPYLSIYNIDDGRIAKIRKCKELATREYEIDKFMIENSINVPKDYQMFKLDSGIKLKDDHEFYGKWVVIQEKINGSTLHDYANNSNVDNDEFSHMVDLAKKEYKKIISLGYSPLDFGSYNTMFDRKKDKVYLIDPVMWSNNRGQNIGDEQIDFYFDNLLEERIHKIK